MFLNKIIYSLRTVLNNCKSNLLINLTALTTITLTFIIFAIFLLLVINLSSFQKHWIERVHVLVYLQDDLKPKAINNLKQFIENQAEVSYVKFVSRDDAMSSLKSSLEGQDGILEGLSYNPLPNSFEVKMKQEFLNIDSIEKFIKIIGQKLGITDIEYGQKWLERFTRFFHFLRITGLSFGLFLFISSLFIISNTIKLMVYSRRDEIEIMKLVGATNRFIKFPFYVEGVIHGLAGSIFALFIVYIISLLISKNIIAGFHFYFGMNTFLFLNPYQLLTVILIGLMLGLTGAFISLNGLKEFKI